MSNIRPLVHSTLNNFLESQDGYHSKVDLLRVIEEEALLMKETQYIIDMFDADSMNQFSQVKPQIERLKTLIQVKSCSRTRTTNDYCKIDAVVTFDEKKCDLSTPCNGLQLTFRYERKRRRRQNAEDGSSSSIAKNGSHIRYSIEMAVNHQQREDLIVVEVWADNNLPSIEKAICVNQMLHGDDDNDNGNDSENDKWDDIERNNEGNTLKESIIKKPHASKEIGGSSCLQKNGSKQKRQKLDDFSQEETAKSEKNSLSKDSDSDSDTNDESNEPDSYLAYLNPDVLHDFLELSGLLSKNPEKMHDGTAFFLLMTFPFYDQEWDLVGHLLEGIFGDDEEE